MPRRSETRMNRDSTQHRPDYYEVMVDAINIYSWCPTPEPTVPPTQVHLHLPIGGHLAIIRFKSPETLDRVIAALIDHRRDVWGTP